MKFTILVLFVLFVIAAGVPQFYYGWSRPYYSYYHPYPYLRPPPPPPLPPRRVVVTKTVYG